MKTKSLIIISLLIGSTYTSSLTQKDDTVNDNQDSWQIAHLKYMDHDDTTTDMPKGYSDTVEMDPTAKPNKKASDEDLDNNFERAMEISPKA